MLRTMITSATGRFRHPSSVHHGDAIAVSRDAMSCVTSITAVPWSRQSFLSSAMICAWIDTSSAVVVRRQTISFGSAASECDHDALPHAARE